MMTRVCISMAAVVTIVTHWADIESQESRTLPLTVKKKRVIIID